MNTAPDAEAPEYLDMADMLSAGVTARQLDHWARRGYLRATEAAPGYGHPRKWPHVEYDVARLMVRLIDAGLTVDVAATTARVAIEHRLEEVVLADGIKITVHEVSP